MPVIDEIPGSSPGMTKCVIVGLDPTISYFNNAETSSPKY
jgi:hypothetical protein